MGERIQSLLDDAPSSPRFLKELGDRKEEAPHKSIVLLGDKAVGKTSLMNRYIRQKFSSQRPVDQ
jgi:GTPase SAR1 family protein